MNKSLYGHIVTKKHPFQKGQSFYYFSVEKRLTLSQRVKHYCVIENITMYVWNILGIYSRDYIGSRKSLTKSITLGHEQMTFFSSNSEDTSEFLENFNMRFYNNQSRTFSSLLNNDSISSVSTE